MIQFLENGQEKQPEIGIEEDFKSSINLSKKKCEVCRDIEFKYKCPGCGTKTCSLNCVTRHKRDSNCTGVRDKSKFISVERFSQLDLLSDYRLLEEVDRAVENYARDQVVKKDRQSVGLPPKLHLLQRVCRGFNRRRCRLLFLPPNFERRIGNSSFFEKRNQTVFWNVDLVFPHIARSIHLKRISENTKVYEILTPFVESGRNVNKDLTSERISEFDVYKSLGFGKLIVLLKIEHPPSKRYQEEEKVLSRHPKFAELDIKKSLLTNLIGQTVVEYPVIHVIFQSHAQSFDIMDRAEVTNLSDKKTDFSDKKTDLSDKKLDLSDSKIKVPENEELEDEERAEKSKAKMFGLFANEEVSDSDEESGAGTRESEDIDENKRKLEETEEEKMKRMENSKRSKLWQKQKKEFEDSSFMRSYALQNEAENSDQKSSDNQVHVEEPESEEDPEQYKQYYDFYLKYYKGKYGVGEEKPKEESEEDKKREEGENSNCKLSGLVSYDESDDE